MKTAPIYLLKDGEADGPHTDEEIVERIEKHRLSVHTLASIEGMPAWRSVKETLVWSQGAVLKDLKARVQEIIDDMVESGGDVIAGRTDLGIEVRNCCFHDFGDSIETILQVNAKLLRNHRLYSALQSDWATESGAPAFSLISSGSQKFDRDWQRDWTDAGGSVKGKTMAALRNSPVWLALSDFGFPFPPFSMDTSKTIEVLMWDEAEDLCIEGLSRKMIFDPVRPFEVVGILG